MTEVNKWRKAYNNLIEINKGYHKITFTPRNIITMAENPSLVELCTAIKLHYFHYVLER